MVLSTQHAPGLDLARLRSAVLDEVILPVIGEDLRAAARASCMNTDESERLTMRTWRAFADLNQALLQKQLDAMCQSEPQSSQAINKGFGVEMLKPYDTPLGEPVRVLVMTEKLYREKRDVAQRVLKCFVEATKMPGKGSMTLTGQLGDTSPVQTALQRSTAWKATW